MGMKIHFITNESAAYWGRYDARALITIKSEGSSRRTDDSRHELSVNRRGGHAYAGRNHPA